VETKTERNLYKCISCGIVDEKVECGGIYHCPNPFCTASGSTYWKTKNLNVKEDSSGITLLNYDGWLEKGMKVINEMSEELRNKIMASPKTKEILSELEKERWDSDENNNSN
jgi:hypothetical protein